MIVLPGLKLTKIDSPYEDNSLRILEVNYAAESRSQCRWSGEWVGSHPDWASIWTVHAWLRNGWVPNDYPAR
jgi:hypothetical protein